MFWLEVMAKWVSFPDFGPVNPLERNGPSWIELISRVRLHRVEISTSRTVHDCAFFFVISISNGRAGKPFISLLMQKNCPPAWLGKLEIQLNKVFFGFFSSQGFFLGKSETSAIWIFSRTVAHGLVEQWAGRQHPDVGARHREILIRHVSRDGN